MDTDAFPSILALHVYELHLQRCIEICTGGTRISSNLQWMETVARRHTNKAWINVSEKSTGVYGLPAVTSRSI